MEGNKAKHHIEIEKCKLSRYEIKANDSVDHSPLFKNEKKGEVRENRGCSSAGCSVIVQKRR